MKIEEQQLKHLFLEIENLMSNINPNLLSIADISGSSDLKDIDFSGLTIDKIFDMLSYLRIMVKYLMFDLESCRREIGSLHRIIAANGDQNDGS